MSSNEVVSAGVCDLSNAPTDLPTKSPYVGMVFRSLDEARSYYEDYAKQQGFCIRTRTTTKGKWKSNDVTGAQFVCLKEGEWKKANVDGEANQTELKKRNRTSSTVRMGCKAAMRILFQRFTGRWIVSAFNDDHNHAYATPEKRRLMKSCRYMPQAVKNLTKAFQDENLRVSKLPSLFGGDTVVFSSKDCWNHLSKMRQKNLALGDAQSVLEYFKNKQAENAQFYYAIQCDEEGRAINFFLVDARGRMAYRSFGDVITFDTTYRTNKYDMPFAPFTGINHHFQSIQFGCALLQDETEDSFLWLFDTWLKAMGGVQPISIITDQDPAMKAAIAKVFPNSRHRLCIWHIKKKFVEKLGHVYREKSEFQKKITRCIHWTYTIEDFEEQWRRLMFEYNLQDNDWLQGLYELRSSWVPIYLRGVFFAGMNTTGRNEGVNSFFDDFVHSKITLFEFVKKYDKALAQIVRNEESEDFVSEHKNRVVDRGETILWHAAQIYTRNIWVKMKAEWDEVNKWRVDVNERSSSCVLLNFSTKEFVEKYHQNFVVQFNEATRECTCMCKKFDFSGIICRHIMKVWTRFDIDEIPESLICKRWMKGANKFRRMNRANPLNTEDDEHAEALRLNHLTQQLSYLSCISAPYNETYVICMNHYIDASKEVEIAIDGIMSTRAAEASSAHLVTEASSAYPVAEASLAHPNTGASSTYLLNPNVSQTKGRKKGKEVVQNLGRIKISVEIATKKRKRLCRSCMQMVRHDTRNFPLNPNARKKVVSSTEDDEADHEMGEDIDSSDD